MRAMPARLPSPGPSPQSDEGDHVEGKRLTVGPGISLSGAITDCDRLVIQGDARVTLHRVRAIEIAETGRFTEGRAEVEQAEIGGVYEGELTVRGRLLIRRTGRVTGTVHYGEIEIERGGTISGSVEVRTPSQEPEGKRGPASAAETPAKVSTLRPAGTTALERDRGNTTGDGAGPEPPSAA
jgi:cytoskeletal protein CcmA (bactofilin family)